MEQEFSDAAKKKIIFCITKELIKHSTEVDMIKLKNIIKSKTDISSQSKSPSPAQSEYVQEKSSASNKISIKELNEKSLEISTPRVPLHLEYFKSTSPVQSEMDLYKITPLIKNPEVKMIIGNPDEKVSVSSATGTKTTDIVLSKEDIDRIINSFSEKSNVPVEEGIYKVNVGNLTLSAIISQVIGSRFVIKKNSLPYSTQIK